MESEFKNQRLRQNETDDMDELLKKNLQKWDEFYSILKEERKSSDRCPNASSLALELLMPKLKTLPWKGAKSDSETFDDYVQEAYLVISEHIGDYDDSRDCGFPTFIMKWLTGLAREVRNDGASDYQIKKHNYFVFSMDAISKKNDSEDNVVYEFEDKGASVEDIVSQKDKFKTDALFKQALGNIPYEENENKTELYINAACYHKCLGGLYNGMPEQLKQRLEEKIRNKNIKEKEEYAEEFIR